MVKCEFKDSTISYVVGNYNDDGDLEIFAGTSTDMICVDIKNENGNTENYWSIFRGNAFRNGYFISDEPVNYVNNSFFEIPKEFYVEKIYPNPFNPQTTISYELNKTGMLEISILNLQGQQIIQLFRGNSNIGSYDLVWDASDISTGIYFVQFLFDGNIRTSKIILMK